MADRNQSGSQATAGASTTPQSSGAYRFGHSSPGALFCGLRKSLREILRSKHSSPMYSVKPMMYSQKDMFFSPRSRHNDQDEEAGSSSTSLWDSARHDPKAHLHFNSAVRQAVEKYSDVLTGLKCHHMEDIISEVMRLCPLLRNDVIVRKKVSGAIKSYICNAVTHYKRKQRNLKSQIIPAVQGRAQPRQIAITSRKRGQAAAIKVIALPSDEEAYQDSPNSYQDDLIDYSANVREESNVSLEVSSIPSPHDSLGGVMLVQGPVQSPSLHHSLPGSSEYIHVAARSTEGQQHHFVTRPRSEIPATRSTPRLIEISDVRTINMETDCVASSADRGNQEFRFSDGPTMEELRSVQADFAKQRDWDQFHQPRNLLLAMIGEVGEVSELFQWRGECKEGLEDWSEKDKKHLGQELSDVLMYLIRLAEKCHVDLPQAAMEKIGLNAKKYPAHKVHGSSKKYTEYE